MATLAPTPSKCVRWGCPCSSSWNGLAGEYCCKSCALGNPCADNVHQVPAKPAPMSIKQASSHPSTTTTYVKSAPAAPRFSRCHRFGCPCTASWNGQYGEYCCKQCMYGIKCHTNVHSVPGAQPTAAPPASLHGASTQHSAYGAGGVRPQQNSHHGQPSGTQGQAHSGITGVLTNIKEGIKEFVGYSSAGDDTAHHDVTTTSAYATRRSCIRPDCKNPVSRGPFCSAECERRGRHKTNFTDPRGHGEPCALVPFYYPGRDEPWDTLYCSSFLGNFYECEAGVTISPPAARGEKAQFTNAEAAFHALKHWSHRRHFEKASGEQSFQLKKIHQHDADRNYSGYGSNWMAMKAVLKAKYPSGSRMARDLLGTGQAFLLEHAARPIEKYWSDNSDGTGSNWLGLQLMLLRDELSDDTGKGGKRWTDFIVSNVDMNTGTDLNGKWQNAVWSATQALLAELSDRGTKSSFGTRGVDHLSPERKALPRGAPTTSMIPEQGGPAPSESRIGGPSTMPVSAPRSPGPSSGDLVSYTPLSGEQEDFLNTIQTWNRNLQARKRKELGMVGPGFEAKFDAFFADQMSSLKKTLRSRSTFPSEAHTKTRMENEYMEFLAKNPDKYK